MQMQQATPPTASYRLPQSTHNSQLSQPTCRTHPKNARKKKIINCRSQKGNNSCKGVEATHVCEPKDEVLILQRPTEPAYMENTHKNAHQFKLYILN